MYSLLLVSSSSSLISVSLFSPPSLVSSPHSLSTRSLPLYPFSPHTALPSFSPLTFVPPPGLLPVRLHHFLVLLDPFRPIAPSHSQISTLIRLSPSLRTPRIGDDSRAGSASLPRTHPFISFAYISAWFLLLSSLTINKLTSPFAACSSLTLSRLFGLSSSRLSSHFLSHSQPYFIPPVALSSSVVSSLSLSLLTVSLTLSTHSLALTALPPWSLSLSLSPTPLLPPSSSPLPPHPLFYFSRHPHSPPRPPLHSLICSLLSARPSASYYLSIFFLLLLLPLSCPLSHSGPSISQPTAPSSAPPLLSPIPSPSDPSFHPIVLLFIHLLPISCPNLYLPYPSLPAFLSSSLLSLSYPSLSISLLTSFAPSRSFPPFPSHYPLMRTSSSSPSILVSSLLSLSISSLIWIPLSSSLDRSPCTPLTHPYSASSTSHLLPLPTFSLSPSLLSSLPRSLFFPFFFSP
ncbi:hypothetical protein C7M84_020592 [Penaeus vannamei]|uniref:Uncharacterized protein n=1 Tax=Penaeus vannamei TaxID=6689 RepID=A0A3R7LX44_PENVA|nr:hypothetical protein C7M84_020592 [Penaeus vannamei]